MRMINNTLKFPSDSNQLYSIWIFLSYWLQDSRRWKSYKNQQINKWTNEVSNFRIKIPIWKKIKAKRHRFKWSVNKRKIVPKYFQNSGQLQSKFNIDLPLFFFQPVESRKQDVMGKGDFYCNRHSPCTISHFHSI